jgi:site-specific DNA-methyltransferase (adenine-specific)
VNVALDTDRVSLIQGDSLEALRSFASKSFDVVITDPPYSPHTHAKLGKERAADGRPVHRKALGFPPIDDAQIIELAEHFVRLSHGWIVVFSDFRQSGAWGRAIERAGGAWIRTGAWVKTNPMPQLTGDRPSVGHEDIVIGHATGRQNPGSPNGCPFQPRSALFCSA